MAGNSQVSIFHHVVAVRGSLYDDLFAKEFGLFQGVSNKSTTAMTSDVNILKCVVSDVNVVVPTMKNLFAASTLK